MKWLHFWTARWKYVFLISLNFFFRWRRIFLRIFSKRNKDMQLWDWRLWWEVWWKWCDWMFCCKFSLKYSLEEKRPLIFRLLWCEKQLMKSRETWRKTSCLTYWEGRSSTYNRQWLLSTFSVFSKALKKVITS